MSSTNIDVVTQDVAAEEQKQKPPVEATANFIPDESASIENSNKLSVKNVYWQYFTRFQEEKEWKAKCNHCKSVLGANPRNETTNLKNHMLHYCKMIKLANSRCIAKVICMHEYPLSFVKHVGMKEVYASMQPTFKVPSQNTIKKDIIKMYELEKLNMTKLMDVNDSRVAVTTDM
ncbi:zinc finger BED domain-containing protein RICESLEEPER 3-like [Arachis stenosperma]|uniref:zinc finger BED domain-containing protein RICESLEEPER 3-like n=1 Tax=Arachis stenosperma TaxID=217475 RepID=UPI0025ACEB02|nr:zinc finger BED domain-containing protein RICESLEEPER 3-like [Arachis stenosperma]